MEDNNRLGTAIGIEQLAALVIDGSMAISVGRHDVEDCQNQTPRLLKTSGNGRTMGLLGPG